MKFAKLNLLAMLTAVLAFVGTVGTVAPNCIGWFYEPKKPELIE